jgi:hypothetical protein
MALRQQQLLSPRREAAALTRRSLAQRHSHQAEVWLDRAEFKELIRPPLAGIVEAVRSDTKSTVTPIPMTAETPGLAGSDVRPPVPIQVTPRPSLTTLPPRSADPPRRQGAPRRFTRFAAAGILALVGGGASVPLMTPHHGSIASVTVGSPAPTAPVAVVPEPDLAGIPPGDDSSGASVAAPNKPADGARPAAATVRTPQTARSTSRSRPPVIMTPRPAPRTPAIPADAYAAWSRLAELSGSDQGRPRVRPDTPPHR